MNNAALAQVEERRESTPEVTRSKRVGSTNEPHYNTMRYRMRMWILRDMLGSVCKVCGVQENLHFHHVRPEEKEFDLSGGFDRPWPQLLEEVKKCELLCRSCHIEVHGPEHGSLTMYSHHRCRCQPCKDAWNSNSTRYKREWRKKKREAAVAQKVAASAL